jgi:hypothetical protein
MVPRPHHDQADVALRHGSLQPVAATGVGAVRPDLVAVDAVARERVAQTTVSSDPAVHWEKCYTPMII